MTTVGDQGDRPNQRDWLPEYVRPLLDTLSDAVVAVDITGMIVYANPAAESLLGWSPGELMGHRVSAVVPPYLLDQLQEGFPAFAEEVATQLTGVPLAISSLRRDGSEILTELKLTVIDDGRGGSVVLGTIRERMAEQFRRFSELTNQFLDTLIDSETAGPAELKLLADIGSNLGWDLTTLWTLTRTGQLVCRHVWIDPSRDAEGRLAGARPAKASGANLPFRCLEAGEPLWVSDLSLDPRFKTGLAAMAGLKSAMAFPIRYQGDVVGVVELLSVTEKAFDPKLVEFLRAMSGQLGQVLVAIEQTAERERLLSEVEAVRRDQDFLLRATRVLAEASDFRETLDALAQLAVPLFADLCLIDVLDEDGSLHRMASRHHDPTKRDLVEELYRDFPPDSSGHHPSVAVVREGLPQWSPEMTDQFLRDTTLDDRHLEIVKALEFTSYMVVPLVSKSQVLGAVTLVSAGSGRRFSEGDLTSAQQLADQVASVVERASRHERDHTVSHTLQRSLLPESLPDIPGLELAARYLPASDYTEVGGDWYDAFAVGRQVALVIGDVEGHDMKAATVMGNLRSALKAFLIEDPSPAVAIARLNHFAVESGISRLATLLVAVIDSKDGALVVASAGHPPPVIARGGELSLIDLTPGPPIGIEGAAVPETVTSISGGTILLYTDGLIEDREHSIDHGLRVLVKATGDFLDRPLGTLVDSVIRTALAGDSRRDDIAVLAARSLATR